MRTGSYRAVPPIGVVSAPEKEEEGEPRDPTPLSIDDPNPSLAGSRRLRWENKLRQSWGEEKRARSISNVAEASLPAQASQGEDVSSPHTGRRNEVTTFLPLARASQGDVSSPRAG
ncbi:hypothetical protein BHE74_00053147 [Ensete ventricosum]|nr:hypothetical protein GW17_00052484 [Ensete ventricosum]RWW41373.1 hypothetical protein BHE74_00053147 [Ensete ventricosum]